MTFSSVSFAAPAAGAASGDGFDREAILAPISALSPAGTNLRYDGIYDAIAEARREDDANVSHGIWSAETKRADWASVLRLSAGALATRSKDLQLACWLAEALYWRDGLYGLAEGLRLLTSLCERFWECLYPQIEWSQADPRRAEPADLEARLAPLLALETRLLRCFAQLRLTDPDRDSGTHYTFQHWVAALRLEALAASNPQAYQRALDAGEVALARICDAAKRTPADSYQALLDGQADCVSAIMALRGCLDVLCAREAPSFARLLTTLADIGRTATTLAGGRLCAPASEPTRADRPAARSVATAPRMAPARLPAPLMHIADRRQAYQMLSEAAEYLLATEPHSPAPYLVKRAIRWAEMPLGGLLAELLDGDERARRLLTLLDIPA